MAATKAPATVYGPWNAQVLQGGVGLRASLPKHAPLLAADASWTASVWVRANHLGDADTLLAGVGAPHGAGRYFFTHEGHAGFWWGHGHTLVSTQVLGTGHWHFLAATADHGTLSLYVDGRKVRQDKTAHAAVKPTIALGPQNAGESRSAHFGGLIADFTVRDGVTGTRQLAAAAKSSPNGLTRYAQASPHWPVQTRQMAGQTTLQAPSSLPHSKAPFSQPVRHAPGPHPAFKASGWHTWTLGDWQLASATQLGDADGARLSQATYQPGKAWYLATVPGTVLTTLVNRGVYPNPDYGLNNMAIPESLGHHDWWYRTTIDVPATLAGQRLTLDFGGINYAGTVWVNGQRIGKVKGAFLPGRFDVSQALHAGQRNVIAVRVSPPPHPGLPQEESLTAGPGPNGGIMELDGPTFLASEGWDWIPSVRDRETGLWQKVTLHATGAVQLDTPRVVTRLPTPDHSRADISVDVPLENTSAQPIHGTLKLSFGQVHVSKAVTIAPGRHTVTLDPANFPQLVVQHPHLWWPNGYGQPYLYQMHLSVSTGGAVSDQMQFHFGIRQISYELSLFDQQGRLRRVLINLDRKGKRDTRIVDIRHRAIRKTPHGWAYSLMPGAAQSPAVTPLADTRLTPYLAIRVNGVRIAIKGGSWGMDDWRKRVSTQRLEPYFKLQRKAHLNVIRNWIGQSTEPAFYDLADKYGLLVFNDFWDSTQDYNIEPQDDALFMRNARAVIRRFRNHPSVALWFGRNEGVPQPLLNQRLDKAIAQIDGTRLYMPSSNRINLQGSGPYNYRPPADYFTKLAQGFSVETGSSSFPTLEAFKAMMPKADQWPISDDWAYHDWHQASNGDVASFMQAMRTKFGKPTSLADFARKAQMMNYVTYRAIFEGMNAHLWSRDSGRMLWMSQPAWPSTMWQLYSHDYDTNAAYFGAMKSAEPVHIQMDLPDHRIAVINNTAKRLPGLDAQITVYNLHGQKLASTTTTLDAGATSVTPVHAKAKLGHLLASQPLVFVALKLRGADGQLLSRNFYWATQTPADLKQLDRLPEVALEAAMHAGPEHTLEVNLRNRSSHMALETKLTLVDAHGQRILPAYYSANYISLAPGEKRTVRISVDDPNRLDHAKLKLRGWNVQATTLSPSTPHS
ncbi:glycoside hydrolase family 2 [Oleiagrimonas sp. C23AA]|nr:glycoside hydrolase family 2 [Oleiagrimonas sp. C23AA]